MINPYEHTSVSKDEELFEEIADSRLPAKDREDFASLIKNSLISFDPLHRPPPLEDRINLKFHEDAYQIQEIYTRIYNGDSDEETQKKQLDQLDHSLHELHESIEGLKSSGELTEEQMAHSLGLLNWMRDLLLKTWSLAELSKTYSPTVIALDDAHDQLMDQCRATPDRDIYQSVAQIGDVVQGCRRLIKELDILNTSEMEVSDSYKGMYHDHIKETMDNISWSVSDWSAKLEKALREDVTQLMQGYAQTENRELGNQSARQLLALRSHIQSSQSKLEATMELAERLRIELGEIEDGEMSSLFHPLHDNMRDMTDSLREGLASLNTQLKRMDGLQVDLAKGKQEPLAYGSAEWGELVKKRLPKKISLVGRVFHQLTHPEGWSGWTKSLVHGLFTGMQLTRQAQGLAKKLEAAKAPAIKASREPGFSTAMPHAVISEPVSSPLVEPMPAPTRWLSTALKVSAITLSGLVYFFSDREEEVEPTKMLEHEAGPGQDKLYAAAASGDKDEIEELLKGGANPIFRNSEGYTPLHVAIGFNNLPALIAIGRRFPKASLDLLDHTGSTYVRWVSTRGNIEALRVLKSLGANLDQPDSKGYTALHVCASNGHVKAVEELLKLKADPNSKDTSEKTPLMYAVKTMNPDIIKALLMAGASVGSRVSTSGYSPGVICQAYHSAQKCIRELGQDSYTAKFMAGKLLSHSWEFNGELLIDSLAIPLEGSGPRPWKEAMSESLEKFGREYPKDMSSEEVATISSLLERATEGYSQGEKIPHSEFQRGLPVLLPTGFNGHHVEVLIHGNYLFIANKGAASRIPIEMYQMDPALMTPEAIKEILELRDKSKSDYQLWLDSIKKRFNLKRAPEQDLLDVVYPYPAEQLVGNCAWESLETAIYGLFILKRMADVDPMDYEKQIAEQGLANQAFEKWIEFTQLESLERFLITFRQDDGTYDKEAQALLLRTFQSIWKKEYWYEEFRPRLEELEVLYKKTLTNRELEVFKTSLCGAKTFKASLGSIFTREDR